MLCDTCSKVNISIYFTQEVAVQRNALGFVQPNSSALNLGSLHEIYSKRTQCAFCRLVFDAVTHRSSRREWHTPDWFLELSERDQFGTQCLIYSYKFASQITADDPVGEHEDGYRIGIGLHPKAKISEYMHHAGEIQLEGSSIFSGRTVKPNRIDIDLAKRWLATCESRHGKACEVPSQDPETAVPDQHPENLLVIDVHELCLRSLPEAARYLALSYCWPTNGSASFQTTKAVYHELLQPYALTPRLKDLSLIVQDAIAFTREFGEHYLWVDALCIVQDDEEYKQSQIGQMDLVYGAAILTIICAHPQPLNEIYLGLDGFRIGKYESEFGGLPGYRSGSRICTQLREEIKGMILTVPFASVDTAVRYSRWDNRAWTFQEHRLSRRKLFFTELQLYFQCSCAVFCEDTVSELILSTTSVYAFSNLWNPCSIGTHLPGSQHISTWLSRSPVQNSIQAITTYKRLFDQYSRRDMTDPGDVVNAFQGTMGILRRTLKTDFIAGIPERFFHEGLLWMNAGLRTRRFIQKGEREIMPFPSWTWAGWMGPILYAYLFEGLVYGEADWFIVDDDMNVGPVKLDTPGAYDEMFDPLDADKKEVRAGELPADFAKIMRPRGQLVLSDGHWSPSQHLACWTTTAWFEISGDYYNMHSYGGNAFEGYRNCIIFDGHGNAAGSILVEKDAVGWWAEEVHMLHFMLLSRSHTLARSLTLFDEEVYEKKGWCYLNVMHIRWKGDVAYRVGVGVIHEDAWIAANPTSMLIKLD
ncbi:HET-domain-containing protein [Lojkania enalia]|uniref:HET-domain-containing protein n=1 Tax=Lojkania enalia TaxID=147567 RepID=A0A9P4K394_9PLEO|nr:HET-domain-containing protein [Didymosphaeria enalia]